MSLVIPCVFPVQEQPTSLCKQPQPAGSLLETQRRNKFFRGWTSGNDIKAIYWETYARTKQLVDLSIKETLFYKAQGSLRETMGGNVNKLKQECIPLCSGARHDDVDGRVEEPPDVGRVLKHPALSKLSNWGSCRLDEFLHSFFTKKFHERAPLKTDNLFGRVRFYCWFILSGVCWALFSESISSFIFMPGFIIGCKSFIFFPKWAL